MLESAYFEEENLSLFTVSSSAFCITVKYRSASNKYWIQFERSLKDPIDLRIVNKKSLKNGDRLSL
jgi:hypothetical protein